LLVANTASFCGYTYQYEGLKKLHAAKSAAGLTVIGVPSQDFNQESADNATVKTFCETRFDIDFPLTVFPMSAARRPRRSTPVSMLRSNGNRRGTSTRYWSAGMAASPARSDRVMNRMGPRCPGLEHDHAERNVQSV
jgi:hypothetical protein